MYTSTLFTKKQFITTMLGMVLLAFGWMLFAAQPAAALSNISPNPIDMRSINCAAPVPNKCPDNVDSTYNTIDTAPAGAAEHILKNELSSQIKSVQMAAYFQTGQDDAYYKKQLVNLFWGYGNNHLKCTVNNAPGSPNSLYITITLKGQLNNKYGSGKTTATYYVSKSNICNSSPYRIGDPSMHKNCSKETSGCDFVADKNQFAANYPVPKNFDATHLDPDADTNNKYFKLEVSIAIGSGVGQTKGGQRLIFKAQTPKAGATEPDSKIGMRAVTKNPFNYSTVGEAYQGVDPKLKGYGIQEYYQFGVPCSQLNPTTQTVSVYDADNDAFGNLIFYVLEDNKPLTNGQTKAYYEIGSKKFMTFVAGNPNGAGDARYDHFILTGPPGETSSISIKGLTRSHNYQLYLRGSKAADKQYQNINVLAVGLPYDSIYGDIECTDVSCTISNPTDVDPKSIIPVDMIGTARPGAQVKSDAFTLKAVDSKKNVLWSGPSKAGQYDEQKDQYETNYKAGPLNAVGDFQFLGSFSYTDLAGEKHKAPCESPIMTSAYRPYTSIYGGDAAAGYWAKEDSGECGTDATAGFESWNKDGGADGTGSYAGGGGQFGVFALGDILHFSSALGSRNVDKSILYVPSQPLGLSFANTVNDTPPGYGGEFAGQTVSCEFDSSHATTATLDTFKDGYPGSGGQIGNGKHPKYLAKGTDVYIGENIKYDHTDWTDVDQIPSFTLIVVGGDIYIDSSVSHLDGTYVVEPNSSGQGGTIHTCSKYNGGDPADISTGNRYDTCQTQLNVYGTMAAKHFNLLRTYSTRSQASDGDTYNSNSAAENFIFGPENWLATGGESTFKYDSVTGLPPVL